MAADDEVQNALLAIHSRLGTIEGRVTLIARAERKVILDALEELVRGDRLIGQIYLLLDGSRSQSDVVQALTDAGIETNPMGVSRRITKMHTDHGLIELVRLGVGGARIFRKHTETRDGTEPVEEHGDSLKAEGATVPVQLTRKRKRSE